MLKPSMQDLMKRVNNRYLLANLAAQRARDLSAEEENSGVKLEEKPIKIALDEICDDKIEYRPGPKPQAEDLLAAASAQDISAADDMLMSAEDEVVSLDDEADEAPVLEDL